MGGKEEDLNEINKFYLNLQLKDSTIVSKNVSKIYDILNQLDEKNQHKYLCLSCIFGAFLGDSIGASCEFSPPSTQNHLDIFNSPRNNVFKPGEVTDDSEMAISAAFAYLDIIANKDLIEKHPDMVQNIIYYYYCIWKNSGPKDIGNATSSALRYWKRNMTLENTIFNLKRVQIANMTSLANGFLMRISTFITYFYYLNIQLIYDTIHNYQNNKDKELPDDLIKLLSKIFDESSKNTEITHPNPENAISSAVFTLMVYIGMVTKDAKEVYNFFVKVANSQKFLDLFKDYDIKDIQEKYLEMIKDLKNIYVYNQMGYYIHGFKLSVYFLKKYPDMGKVQNDNQKNTLYYQIMSEICDYGGDTDTNCAIVGAMVGPIIGYKNFGNENFKKLIYFIPKTRSQFNSAFMYIYVDYLEKKFLKNNQKNEEKKENFPDDNKKGKIEEKKEENKEEKNEEKKEEKNGEKNEEKKEEKKEDKTEEKKIESGEKKIPKNIDNNGSKEDIKNKNENLDKKGVMKEKVKNDQIKGKEFVYFAYTKINEFFSKELDI